MSTPSTFAPSSRRRQRGRAVAAAEVEHVHARLDAERADQLLAALAHGRGDPGEVALFPERLVRIDLVQNQVRHSNYLSKIQCEIPGALGRREDAPGKREAYRWPM